MSVFCLSNNRVSAILLALLTKEFISAEISLILCVFLGELLNALVIYKHICYVTYLRSHCF